MKTLFLTFIVLFACSMVNALSICTMSMEKASSQMQMNGDMDMPCHKTEGSQDQNSEQCDDCNCQHCVQVSILPIQESKDNYGKVSVGIPAGEFFSSHQVEIRPQPPKHLS